MRKVDFFMEGGMPRTVFTGLYFVLFLAIVMSFLCVPVDGAPILGKEYNLRQPDGSKVKVKVWGDEFYQRVESIDGYSLVRNQAGWICYAELSGNESEFVATDAVYGGKELDKHSKAKSLKAKAGFKKKIKIKSSSRSAKSKEARKKLGYDKLIGTSFSAAAAGTAEGVDFQPDPISPAPLLGSVVGLTICIDFPDEAGTISVAEVDDYCNLQGYSDFGNNGSIYDYFSDVSGGNVQYTNVVVGYYTAQNDKSHYDDPTRGAGDAGRELLGEALDALESQGFDFTQLSVDGNTMLAINLFYAGHVNSGWAMGLWPHSGWYGGFTSSSGISSGRYQITDMGSSLEIGTFCHENGHMICQWPDLYDYGYESAGVGMFCLMAYGNADGGNPIPPNAYFRDLKGWDTVTEIVDPSVKYVVPSNSNISFKYPNPNYPSESFYIESRMQTGRSAALPDEGLVIWHVDEAGDNDDEQMTSQLHYMVSLEQADGEFDLENGNNYGDDTDLFDAWYSDAFNDTTAPDAKWWNGDDSGLLVGWISEVGPTMYFGEGIDRIAPTPNPSGWSLDPVATGTYTIVMEAIDSYDENNVEYYFECTSTDDTDPNAPGVFDSGWQSSNFYTMNYAAPGNTYSFRVKVRDLSSQQNETEWSPEIATTTSAVTDDLPPVRNPAEWENTPKLIRFSSTSRIRMSARTGIDESSPCEYYFTCIDVDGIGADPQFDSSWQLSEIYTIDSASFIVNSSYTFTVKVRDALDNETAESSPATVGINTSGTAVYGVPVPYATIQAAINATQNEGDTVIVRPGTYTGPGNINLDFNAVGSFRNITVRGVNPDDPDVVAATIIDCGGMPSNHNGGAQHVRRGFDFHNSEGPKSIVAGFTIRNGYVGIFPVPAFNFPADLGRGGYPGVSAYGGGISTVGSSPTIRNCVISDCYVDGSGSDAAPGLPDLTLTIVGGIGGAASPAGGGGIYCDPTSNPIIDNCTIMNCSVEANGGRGGDSDAGVTIAGGTGGIGGNAALAGGGGIYVATSLPGGNPVSIITNCKVTNCWVRAADGGDGGDAGPIDNSSGVGVGGIGGNGGNAANTVGGGVYFDSSVRADISNCEIASNTVEQGIRGLGGNAPISGLNGANGLAFGGGIYCDTNGSFTIDTSTKILNNMSDNFGGGLAFDDGCTATLTNCEVSGNTAQNNGGGGIWFDHTGTLTMNDSQVTGNHATGQYSVGGGLFAGDILAGSPATVNLNNNTVFSNNTADNGGGIYIEDTVFNMSESELSGNSANDGGGLFAVGGSSVTITGSIISDNTATQLNYGSGGGMVLSEVSVFVMTDSTISNNESNGYGGGLWVNGFNVNAYTITNCLFADNETLMEGGALSCILGSWIQMFNCTIADNEVLGADGIGGGIHCSEDFAYVEISDSIIWNNTASHGAQLAAGRFSGSLPGLEWSDLDVYYCDVQGGYSDVFEEVPPAYPDGLAVVWFLEGNIDADPNFLFGYFLSHSDIQGAGAQSPCVDSGSGSADWLETTVGHTVTTRTDFVPDQGVMLVQGDANTVDMGYHYNASGDIPQLMLTVNVINPEGGHLEISLSDGSTAIEPGGAGSYSFNQGQQVSLQAVLSDPNLYILGQWVNTEDDTSIALDNTVRMDTNKTVTVIFDVDPRYAILRTNVITNNGVIVPSLDGLYKEVAPDYRIYYRGTVVTLTAIPDDSTDILKWFGTDDDFEVSKINQVTLNESANVEVKFYKPNTLIVGPSGEGVYTSIQLAVDAAEEDDIIMIMPGVYDTYESNQPIEYTRIVIDNKRITIRSFNPQDPSETTIIGSFWITNVDRHTLIEGFTITGNYYSRSGRTPKASGADGEPGSPIAGGGMVLYDIISYLPHADTINNASPTVKNCVFLNCSILAGDGGDGADDISDDGIGAVFGEPGHGGWGGWAHGGAVSIGTGAEPKFINCDFIGNYARGGDGGNGGNASPSYGGHGGSWGNPLGYPGLTWEWGPYEEYVFYSGFGGAVYCGNNSSPEFEDCFFNDNTAFGGSCGISGASTVAGWPSSHYRIDRFGGAVFGARGSTPRFENCVFSENEADTVGPESHDDGEAAVSDDVNISFGGGVAFEDGAEPNFINCTFENNIATMGGGAYVTLAGFITQGCTFENNTALNAGALLLAEGTAHIKQTTFRNNTATGEGAKGGAIFSFDSDPEIIDSVFEGNDTVGSGGGIYASGANEVKIHNCLIKDNSASVDGGGISSTWYAEPIISNCNLFNNIITGGIEGGGVGSALAVNYNSHMTLTNSIVWNVTEWEISNVVPVQDLYIGPETQGAILTVTYNDIQGGLGALHIADLAEDTEVTTDIIDSLPNLDWIGNIDSDPLFVSGIFGDLYLSQTASGQDVNSPCVDAGDPDVDAEMLQFMNDYTTSTENVPDNGIIDIGMHYRTSDEEYLLTIEVIGGGGQVVVEPGLGNPEPGVYACPFGKVVEIVADPNDGYRVKTWTGTDNDFELRNTNTVTMGTDRTVTVEFELSEQKVLMLRPDSGKTLYEAFHEVRSGDEIILAAGGVYTLEDPNVVENPLGLVDPNGLDFLGRSIRLVASDYDDPNSTLETVIDCQGLGRAFRFHSGEDANTVVMGLTIINGYVEASQYDSAPQSYGGAILCENASSPTIEGCIFRDCTAVAADGLDGVDGMDGQDAFGISGGGAIACVDFSSPIIDNCTFENNVAWGGDGGAGDDGANDGYAGGAALGGAILARAGSDPIVTNCFFSNNRVIQGSGGIGNIDTLVEGVFVGGAAYFGTESDPNLFNCMFDGNNAYRIEIITVGDERRRSNIAGALYSKAGNTVTINQCQFINHSSGVIEIEELSTVDLDASLFMNNLSRSEIGGGALSIASDCIVVDVNECEFIENSSLNDSDGGAVRLASGAQFTACEFLNNNAQGDGGAIYVDDPLGQTVDVKIDNCHFIENAGLSGGAVYFSYANTTITDSNFVENEAENGGGLYLEYGSLNMTDTDVLTNTASNAYADGGGISCYNNAATIKDSIIQDNAASGAMSIGGGIGFRQGFERTYTVENCLITGNSAGKRGGGIAADWYVNIDVENSTIADNSALYGGGVSASYASVVNIADSIIWGNTGSQGSQLAVTGSGDDASALNITFSDIQPPFDPSKLDPNKYAVNVFVDNTERLIVTPTNDPYTLVNNILGHGITVSNVSYKGSLTSSGTFVGGLAAGLEIDQGIILTCGDAKLAEGNDPSQPGVNTSDGATGSIGIEGDVDLSLLIDGGTTNDASVLEFDFVSMGGDLYFSFVFASEEYNEFVYSFNDVFGFFLDGQNIALIPGTNTPVSVDNINGGNPIGVNASYPEYYKNNDLNDGGPFYANEYDGFTTVLIASALNLSPGTHHIKLAIADALDTALDSAVFIRAGSFSDRILIDLDPTVVVDDGSSINGQIVSEYDVDDWIDDNNTAPWDPSSHNLAVDPNFVGNYFLSHKDAGQYANSPCFDMADPNDLTNTRYTDGDPNFTTRTDAVIDVPNTDLGFHHAPFEPNEYLLSVNVVYDANILPGPYFIEHKSTLVPASTEPNNLYIQYSMVAMQIVPEPPLGYMVHWTGADNSFSTEPNNIVTVSEPNMVVTAELVKMGYTLTVETIGEYGTVDILGYDGNIYNDSVDFLPGQRAELTAEPDDDYRVRRWFGADDDPNWGSTIGFVTMDRDRTVYVEFEHDSVKTLTVGPGFAYEGIEEAVDAASPGDIVIVRQSETPYYITNREGIDFGGKSIHLRSEYPERPEVVAQTIIDCMGTADNPGRAFWFHDGEDPNTIVEGFTIVNGFITGPTTYDFKPAPPSPEEPEADEKQYARDGADAPYTFYPYYGEIMDPNGNGYGGAILCENASSPTIRNCVISNCTATGARGGDGENGTFGGDIEVEIIGGNGGNGYGHGCGGAIAAIQASSPRVINCTITDNTAAGGIGGNGGGGTAPGSGGYGIGAGHGGGLYFERGSEPNVIDCTFVNNIARQPIPGLVGIKYIPRDDSGSSSSDEEEDEPTNGYFLVRGNIAGGGIYLNSTPDPDPNYIGTGLAKLAIEGSEFIGNSAQEESYYVKYTSGGAIFVDPNATIDIRDSGFFENNAGAVHVDPNVNVTIDTCQFIGNQHLGQIYPTALIYNPLSYVETGWSYDDPPITSGAAISIASDCNDVLISNSKFSVNEALEDAGAILLKSDADFDNCSFSGNVAGRIGGAIAAITENDLAFLNAPKINVNFEKTSFAGNQAMWGGGIFTEQAITEFENCHFIKNIAESGGGLLLVDSSTEIDNTKVELNEATGLNGLGGGIACVNTSAVVENSSIYGNSASGQDAIGGGIVLYAGGEIVTHEINNCLVTSNFANGEGGAIAAIASAVPAIRNVTFVENYSLGLGDAVYYDWTDLELARTPTITNSIFSNHLNLAIFGVGSQDVEISHTLFYNSMSVMAYGKYDPELGALIQIDTESLLTPGSNNIIANPLFEEGAFGDYYLDPSSDAVDSGSEDADLLGLGGLVTNPDGVTVDANTVDLGYHYPDATDVDKVALNVSIETGEGSYRIYPESDDGLYYPGSIVKIYADPHFGYRVAGWSGGTINDSSKDLTNIVLMDSYKNIGIRLEEPRTFEVPTEVFTIHEALEMAEDGDVIMVGSGTYQSEGLVIDKEVMITGASPDDLTGQNTTVLSFASKGGRSRCVIFTADAGPGAILNGITLQDMNVYVIASKDGKNPGDDGIDGGGIIGGGVYIESGASPTIQNCVIRNFHITGGNAGNGADGEEGVSGGRGGWGGWALGGGVYIAPGASPTFKGCTITDCSVTGGNGGNGGNGHDGDNADSGDTSPGYGGLWSDSAYEYTSWQTWGYAGNFNHYSGYGGGVYCAVDSEATFIGCTITENVSGGGLSGVGGELRSFHAYPLTSYEIPSYGGGVYCAAGSDVQFEDCIISGNTATNQTDNYVNNDYLGHGGGIAFKDTISISLINTEISENDASVGGGVYWTNSDAEFIDCLIKENVAYQGAGVYAAYGTATINGCNIIRNKAGAFDGEFGPPLVIDDGISDEPENPDEPETPEEPEIPVEEEDVFTIEEMEQLMGIAGHGGGLYCTSVTTNIVDSQLTLNAASASGGAIYLAGSSLIPSTVFNSLVTNNEAGRDGGGISVNWYADAEITNCTIAYNDVTDAGFEFGYGGGVYTSYHSSVDITDSIFWINTAQIGPQLSIGTGFKYDLRPSEVTVSYSAIHGGIGMVNIDDGCEINWTMGAGGVETNIDLNGDNEPELATGIYGGAFYLDQLLSPCVDAGSQDGQSPERFDTNYTTDPAATVSSFDSGRVDMGYHYKHLRGYNPNECRVCDFEPDGVIDIMDLHIFAYRWLELCGFDDQDCLEKDLSKNESVDIHDLAIFASCYLEQNTTPPTPNPAEWAEGGEPKADNDNPFTTIYMEAKPAISGWWGNDVYYYFECTTGFNEGGTDSGWIDVPYYSDIGLSSETGLSKDTSYGYQVYYADKSGITGDFLDPNHPSVTEPSVEKIGVTSRDTSPPVQPVSEDKGVQVPIADWSYENYTDPITSEITKVYTGLPVSASMAGDLYPSITMSAEPAVDLEDSGVQYVFTRVFPDGAVFHSYEPTWTDDGSDIAAGGLTEGVTYYYTVHYIDLSGNSNASALSSQIGVIAVIPDEDDIAPPPVPTWVSDYVTAFLCSDTNGTVAAGMCTSDQHNTYFNELTAEVIWPEGTTAEEMADVYYQFYDSDDGWFSEWSPTPFMHRQIDDHDTSVHTYWVRSRDSAGNISAFSVEYRRRDGIGL